MIRKRNHVGLIRHLEGFTPLEKNFVSPVKKRSSLTGFTLVEIMIVVAIIVALVAIAVPGILRQRMTANEATAVTSLKTICWAAITYRTSNPVYPACLTDLNTTPPAYIDPILASGIKQGYLFNLTGDANYFNATAVPQTPNISGVRTFFVDITGVIRASANDTADDSSPPLV